MGAGSGTDGGCVNAQEDAGEDDGRMQRCRSDNLMRHFRLHPFVLCLLALTGCSDEHEWHEKLTLVVQTPAGEVSGSAVIKVVAAFNNIPVGNEVAFGVLGEATVVEIAPGQYLFALLGNGQLFPAAARDRFRGMSRKEWLYEIPKQTEGVSLLPNHLPMLVTFADVADSTSVKLVDPTNLAATFGPGVALTGAWLEITDEPVTEGQVGAVLGWLCDYQTDYRRLSGSSSTGIDDNELSNNLGPGDLAIGDCK
jgi:hypothetical protein